jgi:ADP-heptose:LPS heptosyltransferase
MTPLVVDGMHGLGDNLHQRAIVRQLIERHTVWLRTPWPSLYHDLAGERLRLLEQPSRLRTQAKNAARERAAYAAEAPPRGAPVQGVWYTPDRIRTFGSILGAMLAHTGCDLRRYDFSLPLKAEWIASAAAWLERWSPGKPLMLYRPLIERTEWRGCAARNPDHAAYEALYAVLRERFFVVSVADLEPGKEWLVGLPAAADAYCHAGELDVGTLAALTARAALVFAAPGFATVLAQAVGTPSVTVYGGHETAACHSLYPRSADHLAIEPVRPCGCHRHDHACDKRIDLAAVRPYVELFAMAAAEGRLRYGVADRPAIVA